MSLLGGRMVRPCSLLFRNKKRVVALAVARQQRISSETSSLPPPPPDDENTTLPARRPPNERETELHIGVLQRQLREQLSLHDFVGATSVCEELIALVRYSYGDIGNPILAACYNNLGLSYKGRQQWEEAVRQLAKATQQYEACNMRNHPSTATALHNMGVCYKEQAQALVKGALNKVSLLDNAASCLGESLERREKVDGKFDRGTNERAIASTRVVLASVLRLRNLQDDKDQAKLHMEEALIVLRQAFTENDDNVLIATSLATALNNQALFQKQDNDFTASLPNYQEALRLRANFLGGDHPQTIATLYNIAEFYTATNEPSKANDIQKDIIERLEPKMNDDDDDKQQPLRKGVFGRQKNE